MNLKSGEFNVPKRGKFSALERAQLIKLQILKLPTLLRVKFSELEILHGVASPICCAEKQEIGMITRKFCNFRIFRF